MKKVNENCYWYEEMQDMNASIPFCRLGEKCTPLESCEGCIQYHNKYKITNADIIRDMSDEQLAEFVHNYACSICPIYKIYNCPGRIEAGRARCYNQWLAWLKREYKEGE